MMIGFAAMDISMLLDNMFHLRISSHAVTMSIIFSAFGSLILAKIIGNFGNITIPLNFSALFVGAILSNSALDSIHVVALRYDEKVLLVTLAGMLCTSLTMMVLQGAQSR